MMNAQTVYSINQDLNDQLHNLRRRMEKLTHRVVGLAPPMPATGLSTPKPDIIPAETPYLDELGNVAHANMDIVQRIYNDLTWFEDNFNLRDSEVKGTASGYQGTER